MANKRKWREDEDLVRTREYHPRACRTTQFSNHQLHELFTRGTLQDLRGYLHDGLHPNVCVGNIPLLSFAVMGSSSEWVSTILKAGANANAWCNPLMPYCTNTLSSIIRRQREVPDDDENSLICQLLLNYGAVACACTRANYIVFNNSQSDIPRAFGSKVIHKLYDAGVEMRYVNDGEPFERDQLFQDMMRMHDHDRLFYSGMRYADEITTVGVIKAVPERVWLRLRKRFLLLRSAKSCEWYTRPIPREIMCDWVVMQQELDRKVPAHYQGVPSLRALHARVQFCPGMRGLYTFVSAIERWRSYPEAKRDASPYAPHVMMLPAELVYLIADWFWRMLLQRITIDCCDSERQELMGHDEYDRACAKYGYTSALVCV